MTPAELEQQLDEVQLLDVREQPEWDAGHVEGAVHVPMHELGARQDELATDRTIVCICRSGQRSAMVTQALVRAGYDAVNLEGGMLAWATERLPFRSADGSPGRVA